MDRWRFKYLLIITDYRKVKIIQEKAKEITMNKLKASITIPNILLTIILLVTVFTQMLPLVGVLNFEFSFLFSILLFLASGILTISYLRKYKNFGLLPAIVRMNYRSYLLLLFAPLVTSIFLNLLFQVCPIWDGILYYLVIVIPSFYFGFVAGVFSFWSNKKFSYLIFGGIFILFALAPIVEFYIYPQVYFYNVIVGIIPGTIYDEAILLSGKLIIYRILHVVLFSLLLYSMFKIGSIKLKEKRILMLSTLLGASLFFLLKPYLGYATTKYSLYQTLNMGVLTPSLEIRYEDNLTDANAHLLTYEMFYYLKEIKRKTKLSTPKNIVAYIFKDSKQKGALFGSKAANVAKPWMNEIYLDYNSYEGTLEHELTHLYAAQIGSTPFKIADGFNMAMLEGYAMAIEDNYSGYDIHYMALLAKESGYNFNIPELFSRLNFFSQASSLSYITAGSFVKFLIEVYGIEKVNSLYQDLNFEKHLSKNLEELSAEYLQFLDALNYPINEHRANYFFGRSPITKKVCARTVSNEINSAWKLYGEQSYYPAQLLFTKVFEYSNSYSALLGIINANNKLGLQKESLELLSSKMNEYEGTSSYYSALLNIGDLISRNGDFERADSVYKILSFYEPTLRYKNLADVRSKLISENRIIDYLSGSNFDKYQILKELNNTELFDASIPILINLSNSLDENITTFILFLGNKNIESISSNSAYEISKYLMRNMEFTKALEFAKLSIQKCSENYRLPILKSHKQKVEWFVNNG